MSERHVWVTGVGAVTAAGLGADRLRSALLDAQNAVHPSPALAGLPVGQAPQLPRCETARHLDRSAALFCVAAREAWQDAGLGSAALDPSRVAVIEGSSLGALGEALAALRVRLSAGRAAPPRPTALVRFMIGAGGAAFAHAHCIRGPVLHVSAGSVSATCAIGDGLQKVAAGLADVAVVGGAECPLQQDIVDHFRAAGVLAHPQEGDPVCCPFDSRRTGTVLGEGAGALVLEGVSHAQRRGARPRALVEGFGLACEAYSMVAPDPDGTGVAAAARQALQHVALDEIGWIKTHGTGTTLNDAAECCGFAALFGERLVSRPLTSLKPALGHCLGASGAVEAVAVALSLEEGIIPATLGTIEVDPALPRCKVATRPTRSAARRVLLISESFGGRCAALVMSRP